MDDHLNASISFFYTKKNSTSSPFTLPRSLLLSSEPNMSGLKMLCLIRRRGGVTRREFLDYHFQTHGAKSEAPTEKETPL